MPVRLTYRVKNKPTFHIPFVRMPHSSSKNKCIWPLCFSYFRGHAWFSIDNPRPSSFPHGHSLLFKLGISETWIRCPSLFPLCKAERLYQLINKSMSRISRGKIEKKMAYLHLSLVGNESHGMWESFTDVNSRFNASITY